MRHIHMADFPMRNIIFSYTKQKRNDDTKYNNDSLIVWYILRHKIEFIIGNIYAIYIYLRFKKYVMRLSEILFFIQNNYYHYFAIQLPIQFE